MASCYHCRQALGEVVFHGEIGGQQQDFCCSGCRSVAALIHGDGLQDFYQFRDAGLIPPTPLTVNDENYYRLHDRDDVLRKVSHAGDKGQRVIQLGIEGITCAACVWLLERHIGRLPGVASLWVNLSNHRAELTWNPEQIPLSQVFIEIHKLGYRPYPFSENEEEKRLAAQQRSTLIRIGIAGIGMMQNMMLAIPVYAGLLEQSGDTFLSLFWIVSLIIATPVVFYSARPFFIAALRDLRTGHLTMDVPVSLAIGGAYAASVFITLFGGEEVYYDAVCMFTFFLLVGRYLEGQARIAAGRARQTLGRSTPELVRIVRAPVTPIGAAPLCVQPGAPDESLNGARGRLAQDAVPASSAPPSVQDTTVAEDLCLVEDLQSGDHIRVAPGEMIPVDGEVVAGQAAVNEAALTGEFHPRQKGPGDSVLSGSLVVDESLVIRTTRPSSQSHLSMLQRLVERAATEKPRIVVLADRVASYFVAAVLVGSIGVALLWWFIAPERTFAIVLSVLVATCPCALSLATPTALTTATNTLRGMGFIITRGHVIQTLARARQVFFDKTGTLTCGAYALVYWENFSSRNLEDLLALAGALEKDSLHPVARFFSPFSGRRAEDLRNVPGAGVSGRLDGRLYYLGTAAFTNQTKRPDCAAHPDSTAIYFTEDGRLIAVFYLNDTLRPGAATLVAKLRSQFNLDVEILTGDTSRQGATLATLLQVPCASGLAPEDKLQRVKEAATRNTTVMVGDGLNDVAAMAGAHLSIAMAEASDLTQVKADALLLNPDPLALAEVLNVARRTERIIRQNLLFSLGYNLTILPLAAAGFVPPYLAAIGMSASSLIVVLNALRLSRRPQGLTSTSG